MRRIEWRRWMRRAAVTEALASAAAGAASVAAAVAAVEAVEADSGHVVASKFNPCSGI